MKSIRTSVAILSASVIAVAASAAEPPEPPAAPPAPTVAPAPEAPTTRPSAPAVQQLQALQRAQMQADAARLQADAARQRFQATYVRVLGKTEKAAYVGVSTSPVNAALGEQLKLPRGIGLLVDFVEAKSPAEEVQLKQYDVLEKLDDQLLVNAHQFAVLVRTHKPGDEVTLTVIRRGERMPVKVKLVEREVMALDANNPWGTPPVPGEARPAFDITSFQPVGIAKGEALSLPGGGNSFFDPVLRARGGDSFFDPQGNGEMRWSDDQGTLVLRLAGPGRKLVVMDKDGKTIATYQLDDDKQVGALPEGVRGRYQRMLQIQPRMREFGAKGGGSGGFGSGPVSVFSTTQPAGVAIPGFGQPGEVRLRVVDPTSEPARGQ